MLGLIGLGTLAVPSSILQLGLSTYCLEISAIFLDHAQAPLLDYKYP